MSIWRENETRVLIFTFMNNFKRWAGTVSWRLTRFNYEKIDTGRYWIDTVIWITVPSGFGFFFGLNTIKGKVFHVSKLSEVLYLLIEKKMYYSILYEPFKIIMLKYVASCCKALIHDNSYNQFHVITNLNYYKLNEKIIKFYFLYSFIYKSRNLVHKKLILYKTE